MKRGNRLLAILLASLLTTGAVKMPVAAGEASSEYATVEDMLEMEASEAGTSEDAVLGAMVGDDTSGQTAADNDSIDVSADETTAANNENLEASDDAAANSVDDIMSEDDIDEGSDQRDTSEDSYTEEPVTDNSTPDGAITDDQDDSYDSSSQDVSADNEQQAGVDDNADEENNGTGGGDFEENPSDSFEESTSSENAIEENETQPALLTPEQIRAFQENVKVWKHENQITVIYDSKEVVALRYSIYSGVNDVLLYSGNLIWDEQSNLYQETIDFDAMNETRKAEDENTEEINIRDIPLKIVVDDGNNQFEESVSSDLGVTSIDAATDTEGQIDLLWESSIDDLNGYSVLVRNVNGLDVQVIETTERSMSFYTSEIGDAVFEVAAYMYDDNTGIKQYFQSVSYDYAASTLEEPVEDDGNGEDANEEQDDESSMDPENADDPIKAQETNEEASERGKTDEQDIIADPLLNETVSTEAAGAASFSQTEYNGHMYQLFNEGVSWSTAKSRCEAKGGHLVTITSAAEHNFCKSLLDNLSPKYCWIGASSASGTWKWVTGETWGYTDWSPTSPNGSGGGTYIEMQNWPGISRAWNWDDQGNSGTSPSKKYQGAPYYHLTKNYCYICEWDYKVTIEGTYTGVVKKQINVKATIDSISLTPTASNVKLSAVGIDTATGAAATIGTMSITKKGSGKYEVSCPIAFSAAGRYSITVSFNGVSGLKNIDINPEKILNVRWSDDACGHNQSSNVAAVHRRLAFYWNPLQFITGYRVQISEDSEFSSGRTNTFNSPSNLPSYIDNIERDRESTWYVRVAAYYRNEKEYIGEWSDPFKMSVCSHLLPGDFWGIENSNVTIQDTYRRTFFQDYSGDDGGTGTCFGNVFAGLTALLSEKDYFSYLDSTKLSDISTYSQNENAREMIYLAQSLCGNIQVYTVNPEGAQRKNDLQLIYDTVLDYTVNGGIPTPVNLGKKDKNDNHSILLLDILQDKDNKVDIRVYDSNYGNTERLLSLYYNSSHRFTKWKYGSISGKTDSLKYPYIWMVDKRDIPVFIEMMDSYLLDGRNRNSCYRSFLTFQGWPAEWGEGDRNYFNYYHATHKVDISTSTIEKIQDVSYNGDAWEPRPTVKIGNYTLIPDEDYTLSYSNNTNVGTATVTVTGVGDYYYGTKTATFKINKGLQSILVKPIASTITVGKTATVSITGAKGKKSYKSSDPSIATVSAAGVVTGKKPGTVTITATSAETANYKAASKTVKINVGLAKPENCRFVKWNNAKYTSCQIAWDKVKGAEGYQTLLCWTNGSNVSKTIVDSNVLYRNCSVHPQHVSQMRVRAFYMQNGQHKFGPWSNVEYITPSPTTLTINNASSGSNLKMNISWNIIYGCDGYNVFLTTDPNGKWYWNQSTPVKATATSAVISEYKYSTKLEKNTRYYVRIVTRRQRNGVFCTVPMPANNTYIDSFIIK